MIKNGTDGIDNFTHQFKAVAVKPIMFNYSIACFSNYISENVHYMYLRFEAVLRFPKL